MTPEKHARRKIDTFPTAAGWAVSDKKDINRNVKLGAALCDAGVSTGEADYLLFIAGIRRGYFVSAV